MRPATVLLLHAFPLDPRMWRAQERALTEDSRDVVAPELPGDESDVGLERWARRVLAAVDGPLVVAGCSMGGYLAFELWRQAAERIAALALIDTRATPDTPEQREARNDSIRVLLETGFEPFWSGLAPKLFAAEADPDVVDQARRTAAEQPIPRLVAALETLRDRPDSRATLPTIDVPVLVAVGEEDLLTPPADSEAMVASLPNARFVRLTGAGHLTPLERPGEIADALVELVRKASV